MAEKPCYGFNNHRAKVSLGGTMNPHLTGTSKRPKPAGAGSALSLEEELAAAIHGAFELAVEIAVREVTKLVGQTGDAYEDMRRENESLRQRLKRAEALLDSACVEERGGGSPPTKQVPNGTNPTDPPPHLIYNETSRDPNVGDVHSCMGVRGDAPLGGASRANQHPDPEPKQEEQRSGGDVKTLHVSDAACGEGGDDGCAVACDVLTREVSDAMSRVCVVRVESMSQSCREVAAQHHNLPPLPSADDESTSKQFTVKQERPEEEGDDSACCLDLIKMEDFSPECMSAVQSKMLEEWKPEMLDIQCQDSNAPLARLALDHQSLSSDFPKIFQLAEPAPVPEAPPRDYVHVRVGRSLGHAITNHYACKSCGQTFHLPSLLRRHHGQCQQKPQQQKPQQCYQQPVNGSKRTRLQLYPPGCSPFRCTECNREFNRMENLKTHLRIHTGERPYTCSVCSKCFRHSGALTRHFRIHTGEKPYICGQCGKSFRNCGGLKFHQRSHRKQLQ